MDAQAALEAVEIVVGNILPDHPVQLLPAGEFPSIIALPLEDAPEALQRNTSVPPQHDAPPHTDAPDETVSVIPPLQLFHFF